MNIHVLPETADAINKLVAKEDPACNTQGKVVDQQFAKKKAGQKNSRKKSRPS
jgi:hypothetical protein